MAVEILEIHHTGVRVDDDGAKLKATQDFYADVLGAAVRQRPLQIIPGIPGAWVNVGEVGQIHLIGGSSPRCVGQGARARIRRGRKYAYAVQEHQARTRWPSPTHGRRQ